MPALSPAQARLRRKVDRLTPLVRRQVADALARLQRGISAGRVYDAIARGDIAAVQMMTARLSADLQQAARTITRAFVEGVAVAKVALGQDTTGIARLDITNPLAIDAALKPAGFIENAAGQMRRRWVTNVTTETRQAIRAIVAKSFKDGLSPRDTAALIKPIIGLTRAQALAVATRHHSLIASGMSRARAAVDRDKYAERLRARRATTIARTEIIQASADGQIAVWKQAQRSGLLPNGVMKQWIVTPDDRLCPNCGAMYGPRALAPIDGMFLTPLGPRTGPTMHPNCRCAVVLVAMPVSRRSAA
jgi:hypothetical protein